LLSPSHTEKKKKSIDGGHPKHRASKRIRLRKIDADDAEDRNIALREESDGQHVLGNMDQFVGHGNK
jgi:hypothetical protein